MGLSPGAVSAPSPPGLLQPALRGDGCEQAAEAGRSSEGGVSLQRLAGGEWTGPGHCCPAQPWQRVAEGALPDCTLDAVYLASDLPVGSIFTLWGVR